MEFLQSPTFFPLSRTAVARIGEALSTLTLTYSLTHAKWRQRADIAIPFQVSLTSTHLHEKARCAQGVGWITPVKTLREASPSLLPR